VRTTQGSTSHGQITRGTGTNFKPTWCQRILGGNILRNHRVAINHRYVTVTWDGDIPSVFITPIPLSRED
jgi:hypothetical protein